MIRWSQWRTVRAKLMLVVLATTTVALLVAGFAMVANELKSYDERLLSDLSAQADIIARASSAALVFDDRKSAAEDLRLLKARPQILAAAIYRPDGRLFATYRSDGAPDAHVPLRPEASGHRIAGNELELYQRISDGSADVGTIYLRSRYELRARLQAYLGILGGVLVASLLVAFAMSVWLQATVTQPIVAVADAAREVMEQRRFSLRVPKTTNDEIGYLVDSFNGMLTEIGRRQDALQQSNETLEREMVERHAAERALRDADQRKDEFLATLAHELRNPLAPLRNALEIMKAAPGDPHATAAAREMMERQLRQLVRLVDDLLDVSRITIGKIVLKTGVVDVVAVAEGAVASTRAFIDQQRHTLDLRLPERPLHVEGDATRLEQVVANVLHNAAKYTDPGGRITLTVTEAADTVEIRIADSGIGIAPDMLRPIFAMFAQADRSLERSRAGLGVGLTLANRLVELHGGTIDASSDGPGRGSEFVIRLPRLLAPPAAVARTASAAAPLSPPLRKILLADDNADFVDSFALILRSLGHDVVVARDGVAALQRASETLPDIAFLDIGLPGLHGYDLAQAIRRTPGCERMTLVAITGWGQVRDRQLAYAAGFDYHFMKPVAPEQIDRVLRDPTQLRDAFAAELRNSPA